jgi:hypothetical protein
MTDLIEIKPSDLIDNQPQLSDFYNDMGKKERIADYGRRGYYVFELEETPKSNEHNSILTVWRPQMTDKYQSYGRFIPHYLDKNKYYWIATKRRYLDEHNNKNLDTVMKNDYHFEETTNASYYNYDGPEQRAEVVFLD